MKKSLGERLRELRGSLSQIDFAFKINVKQTTYSAWERNLNEPTLSALADISNIFHVSLDWLLGLSDDRRGIVISTPSTDYEAKLAEKDAEIARLNGIIEGLRFALTTQGKGK